MGERENRSISLAGADKVLSLCLPDFFLAKKSVFLAKKVHREQKSREQKSTEEYSTAENSRTEKRRGEVRLTDLTDRSETNEIFCK